MKVTYTSPRTGQPVTVEGTPVEGRYPHLYVHLDTPQGLLRIPRSAIVPAQPTCDGDHWMRTRDGRVLWCTERECIVHGSGMQE